MKSDCSGESDHLSLKRTVRYALQKSQNEAYQVVLSPRASSGRDGIYQPFITSCRKPPLTRRSRRMRLRSDERTATTPRFCSASRASRESASFCCGVAIRSGRQAEWSVSILAYYAVHLLAYSAVLKLASCFLLSLAYSASVVSQR